MIWQISLSIALTWTASKQFTHVFCRCKCGKCAITLLQNISECYCCQELEGCCESLGSDMMRQDLDEDETLKCITEHPGFRPVCLEKWSLRLAASKYKTKAKQQYTQKGDEDRFVNITRLVWCSSIDCNAADNVYPGGLGEGEGTCFPSIVFFFLVFIITTTVSWLLFFLQFLTKCILSGIFKIGVWLLGTS